MNKKVRLRSFHGKLQAPRGTIPKENYWALIGHCGEIIEPRNERGRVLVKFEVSVGSLGLACHNPVENSLYILESDLEETKGMNMHCCTRMEEAVTSACGDHADRHECPDCLIDYNNKFDEYGIIIHDGGSSVLTIDFCPWCGSKLPESRRDEWFEELEAIGITDPQDRTIPAKYLTDEWCRSK